jgi:hypothetical protein
VSQFCEGSLQRGKQERWHHQSQSIHRHEMVDAMKQEMQHEKKGSIGQPVVNMKEEPVQGIFEQGPDYVSCEEAQHGLDNRAHRNTRQ